MPERNFPFLRDREIPPELAQEMATVGMVVSNKPIAIGRMFTLAGQVFVITGQGTKVDLIERGRCLPEIDFSQAPDGDYFYFVSTD